MVQTDRELECFFDHGLEHQAPFQFVGVFLLVNTPYSLWNSIQLLDGHTYTLTHTYIHTLIHTCMRAYIDTTYIQTNYTRTYILCMYMYRRQSPGFVFFAVAFI